MQEINTLKLAAPGAGLPWIELGIANVLFRIRLWTGNRERFNAKFALERRRIERLIKRCDAASGAVRVLIARPPGLEDSSRYWSVWMTLDHLRIVHLEVAEAMQQLAEGRVPEKRVSTAAVKPAPDGTAEIVSPYEASCDAVMKAFAAISDLHTKAKLAHPWFGPMDAFAWHGLLGGHMGIHRVQIERILHGLPNR